MECSSTVLALFLKSSVHSPKQSTSKASYLLCFSLPAVVKVVVVVVVD
jgi:hypothetical protein